MPSSFSSPITSSSPIVAEVMKRKKQINVSEKKLKWAIANLVAAMMIFLEAHSVSFHLINPESSWRNIISYLETAVLMVCMIILHIIKYYLQFKK